MQQSPTTRRSRGALVALGLLVCGFVPGPVRGEGTDPGFTFRRVSPPAPGTKRLITVQVDLAPPPAAGPPPEVTLAALKPLGPVAPLEAPSGRELDLFWASLSPERGPMRLAEAAALLESSAARSSPGAGVTVGALRGLGQRYGPAVTAATHGRRVSPALVLAVMMVESAGRSDAISRAGAAGLMQLMPETAARFGVRDRLDPDESIRGGVAYLDWLLTEFKDDAVLALAGYNAGENAVKRYGGVPPFAETRAYVPKVVAAWRAAGALCATAQRLAADDCDLQRYALAKP